MFLRRYDRRKDGKVHSYWALVESYRTGKGSRQRVVAYEAAASLGGMLVGKLVTRGVVLKLFKKSGLKLAAKTATKVVPLAGQVASAAIGFVLFRQMGYQHVQACVKVVEEVGKAGDVAGH